MKSGSLFQSLGDTYAKDLSPYVEILDLGTERVLDLEERRVRTGLEKVNRFAK